MAALTAATAQPNAGTVSRVRGYSEANVKVRYFDVTLDTGDFVQAGLTITAASLGYKAIYFVTVSTGVIMSTDKALANGYGVSYATDNTSVKLFLYEGGADGDSFDIKPAEANASVFPFRIKVEGV